MALPPRAKVPVGLRLYVIGDIHGRVDLLKNLMDKIHEDMEKAVAADKSIQIMPVFLGDYIDRGLQSRQVLEYLLSIRHSSRYNGVIFLRGNHEQAVLDYLDDPEEGERWLQYGGVETLISYGIGFDYNAPYLLALEESARSLRHNMPETHKEFLGSLPLTYEAGDYFFAHAGVDVTKPFNEQDSRSLMFMREPFLSYSGQLEKIVVHGHTISAEPEILGHRIGIDTGAYATGKLTCLVLQDADREIISTQAKEVIRW